MSVGQSVAPKAFFHSDDNGEFYLSTDETEHNVDLLCSVPGSANTFILDDDAERSALVTLVKDNRYYFEAFWKEVRG